jgi:phosphoadenosine phosphosulfate reductase
VDEKIQSVVNTLIRIQNEYGPAAFANSLGAEDMVLTDLILKHAPKIEIFTLDTGRLPAETYDLIRAIKDHYQFNVRVYFPDAAAVEAYVNQNGPNAFYESLDLRKSCCHIRKVEPLRRALKGKKAWITGMRREQAASRQNLAESEFDADNGLQKFNPLIDWTEKEVWNYIRANKIPYNALHDKFYPSIGCAPCTRSVTPGEDVRAGRWWWEQENGKECGLHVRKKSAA